MSKSSSSTPNESLISSAIIPVTNPNGLSSIYANSIGGAATLLDFSLFFLEMGQMPGEKGPIPKHELKAVVTLPIGTATALIQLLQQMIAGHQKALSAGAEIVAAKVDAKQ